MAKDPAVLIYIDKWLASTNGMRAEFRAWYFDLMLHQYDKGSVPNDHDEIAGICRVRPSEYICFKQMLEQMLYQKFSKCEDGNLRNKVMIEIMSSRENFKEKRSLSGTIGVIIKLALTIPGYEKKFIEKLKTKLSALNVDELDQYKDKQMLEHLLKLYINEDINNNTGNNTNTDEKNNGEKPSYDFEEFWIDYDKKVGNKDKIEKKFMALPHADREMIREHIPRYKAAQPDKQYRKNPETFLNNKSWKDEIIGNNVARTTNNTAAGDRQSRNDSVATMANYAEAILANTPGEQSPAGTNI